MKTYLPMMLMAAPLCLALDPAAVSMDLTRDTADAQLDKNYTSAALADISVRRHWDSEKGRSIDLDFNGTTNKLICATITYDKPVPVKKATRDAKEIAKGGSITWKPLPAENAKKYEVENAQASKVGDVYLIMECDKSGKCTRLSLHNSLPDRNRALMTPVDTDVKLTAGAMGSNADVVENARLLMANEATRKGVTAQAATPAEPVETEPDDSTEPAVAATPATADDDDTETVAVQTAMGTSYEKRSKHQAEAEAPDEQPKKAAETAPKGPLDDITPLHWCIGGGALVLLIILWKLCTGNNKDDATRMAIRAAALRQNGGPAGSPLRPSTGMPRRPRR